MLPHQERVVVEKRELDERLIKFAAFGRTEVFASLPTDEQNRLNRQLAVLEEYSCTLSDRIAAFPAE